MNWEVHTYKTAPGPEFFSLLHHERAAVSTLGARIYCGSALILGERRLRRAQPPRALERAWVSETLELSPSLGTLLIAFASHPHTGVICAYITTKRRVSHQ